MGQATFADLEYVSKKRVHGAERRVWGDAGYQGVGKRPENNGGAVDWRVALKPGKRRALAPDSAAAACERARASVRAKVEHPFLYLSGASATPGCATGGWRRTGNGSRFCWASPT